MATAELTDIEIEDLEYVRGHRKSIIDRLIGNLNAETLPAVLGALKDMDQVTLSKAKLRISNKAADAATGAAFNMVELLKAIRTTDPVELLEDHGAERLLGLPTTYTIDKVHENDYIGIKTVAIEEVMQH